MNVVKDLPNLIKLLNANEMFVIFPIGSEGQSFMDFLKYTNLSGRVCCVAKLQDLGSAPQTFINELPIIPFEFLVHFRETNVLIIAAPEQFHVHLNEELTRFGFKSIVFIRSNTQKMIEATLKKAYSSGDALLWYMSYFDRKIYELGQRIDKQNEICEVNTKAFGEYRNAFRGKDVVIVGTGATLKHYKPIKDAIHIGLNYAWKHNDISFDYLFLTTLAGGIKAYLLKIQFNLVSQILKIEYLSENFLKKPLVTRKRSHY